MQILHQADLQAIVKQAHSGIPYFSDFSRQNLALDWNNTGLMLNDDIAVDRVFSPVLGQQLWAVWTRRIPTVVATWILRSSWLSWHKCGPSACFWRSSSSFATVVKLYFLKGLSWTLWVFILFDEPSCTSNWCFQEQIESTALFYRWPNKLKDSHHTTQLLVSNPCQDSHYPKPYSWGQLLEVRWVWLALTTSSPWVVICLYFYGDCSAEVRCLFDAWSAYRNCRRTQFISKEPKQKAANPCCINGFALTEPYQNHCWGNTSTHLNLLIHNEEPGVWARHEGIVPWFQQQGLSQLYKWVQWKSRGLTWLEFVLDLINRPSQI